MGAEGGEESSSMPPHGEVASGFIDGSRPVIVQRIWPAARFYGTASLPLSHFVNGMPQRVEHGFVRHLGHGWVSVYGVGDVLQNSAHFEGQGPLSNLFADVVPTPCIPRMR